MAIGFDYDYDYEYNEMNSNVAITTKQATDHRQIILLETEWHDLKRFSECIIIEKQKTDWFSIMLGAAASTMITFLYYLFNFFAKDNQDPHEIIFYACTTLILLVISMIISLRNRNKIDNLLTSKVQHNNLCLKIEEIENRVKSEPLGDI